MGAGSPTGLLLALTKGGSGASGGTGTPYGLLIALTVTGTVVTPPSTGQDVGGGHIPRGGFSRKRWLELVDAREAQLRAEERAEELSEKKRQRALKAARIAERAIDLAQAYDANISRLTAALNSAASAHKTVTEFVRAEKLALAMIARIEEEEDEDDVITFLLLH